MISPQLDLLIKQLSQLPSVGKRSAQRMALHLLKNKDNHMIPLAMQLERTANSLITCNTCGNIDSCTPCTICNDIKRDAHTLCVVEDIADIWALERGAVFRGRYHVLGGTLSAIDGRTPDTLNIASLPERITTHNISEIILATNATLEGQTTAHYITELLVDTTVKVTRLAHGIPLGGELDYLDEGTLAAALQARSEM